MATKNDQQALLQLIKDNRRIIFKVCNTYCKNRYNRQDLEQEIIYQLWRSYSSYKTGYKFTTWMYRVALNVAITFYRKNKVADKMITLDNDPPETIYAPDNDPDLEKNIGIMQQFIAELKELDKALMLLYLEEKTYSEIAEILGITETNVATKVSRIKEKLKQRFDNLQ